MSDFIGRCQAPDHKGDPDQEVELCKDLYCRECHISIGFDECNDDSWANALRAKAGLPPMTSGKESGL